MHAAKRNYNYKWLQTKRWLPSRGRRQELWQQRPRGRQQHQQQKRPRVISDITAATITSNNNSSNDNDSDNINDHINSINNHYLKDDGHNSHDDEKPPPSNKQKQNKKIIKNKRQTMTKQKQEAWKHRSTLGPWSCTVQLFSWKQLRAELFGSKSISN